VRQSDALHEYEEFIASWFASRGCAAINRDRSYIEQGLVDSLGIFGLIDDVEQHCGVMFSSSDMQREEFFTISGLAKIAHAKNTLHNK
jgi:acyl carrier protein